MKAGILFNLVLLAFYSSDTRCTLLGHKTKLKVSYNNDVDDGNDNNNDDGDDDFFIIKWLF